MRLTVYTQPRGYGEDWYLKLRYLERTLSKSNTAQKAQKVSHSNKEWPLVREFQGMFLLLSSHNQMGDLHPEPGHPPGQAVRTTLRRTVCDY